MEGRVDGRAEGYGADTWWTASAAGSLSFGCGDRRTTKESSSDTLTDKWAKQQAPDSF